jgi:hypothetical protein
MEPKLFLETSKPRDNNENAKSDFCSHPTPSMLYDSEPASQTQPKLQHKFLSGHESTLPTRHAMGPSPSPHTLFDGSPNALDNLSIAPSAFLTLASIPLLNLHALDHTTPTLDRIRHLLASPTNINAECVGKQLRGVGPLVTLKLPGLARGEDGNNPLPVVGLELIWGVDEDEA